MLDVAIIGCGVIGAAAAYELSHYPLQTAIFEAENDVADCTTKANSAILHAGYDPEPGTRMARLNVEGSALAKEICARLDVPYLQCGSLVLALSPEELPHLQKLYENGIANGVPGIRLLSAEETLAMEPNLAPTVVGALYAPSAAIVSPWEFALAMAEVAVRNGVELHRSCPVTHIEKTAGGWALTTPSGIVETRYIIMRRVSRRRPCTIWPHPTNLPSSPPGANTTCWINPRAAVCTTSSSSAPTKTARAFWWPPPSTATCSSARTPFG